MFYTMAVKDRRLGNVILRFSVPHLAVCTFICMVKHLVYYKNVLFFCVTRWFILKNMYFAGKIRSQVESLFT